MAAPVRAVPLDQATHQQLVYFARTSLELDVGSRPTRDAVVSKLMELGHDVIWVSAAPEGPEPLPVGEVPQPGEHETHPDRERWVHMRIPPEKDPDGKPRDSVVPVAVNDRIAVLPRGKPVWAAEIFYAHLKTSCVETRYAQEAGEEGRPGLIYSYEEPRFEVQFIKYGGRMKDNPIPEGYVKGDVVVGPEGFVPTDVVRSHLERVDHRVRAA